MADSSINSPNPLNPLKPLNPIQRLLKRRLVRALLIFFGAWFIFCIILMGVVYFYGRVDRAQPEDVMIVLGTGLNRNLTPSAVMIRRARHAADLWKAGYAPEIICSGGHTTSPDKSEAQGCAQVLIASGVPSADILLEQQSLSTEQNAVYSQQIMAAHGWKTALVVSDGFHLLRATWIFSQHGIPITTSPCAPPQIHLLLLSLVREVVALHWQVFKTVFNLPITYVPWV